MSCHGVMMMLIMTVLVGYQDAKDAPLFETDLDLLRSRGIIIMVEELPRLLSASKKLTFAEMALLKVCA